MCHAWWVIGRITETIQVRREVTIKRHPPEGTGRDGSCSLASLAPALRFPFTQLSQLPGLGDRWDRWREEMERDARGLFL